MKISRLDAWIFHHPLESPFHPSWVPGYASTNASAVIYRLVAEDATEGIAGGVAFADEARGPINLLRAYLVGLDVDDVAEAHSRLRTAYQTLGVRAWFAEVAVWDLKAKSQGKTIAQMLGAKRDRVRAYCSTGELRSAEDAAAHAKRVLEHGFKGIKIRTRHATLDEDIAMLEAVRGAVGDEIALMCDANQAWRVDAFEKGPVWDLARASEFAKAAERAGVEWIEEPLEMFDFAGYARLCGLTDVKIAAGELHGEPGLVRLLIDAGGVDVVQPDLCFTGGVTGAWWLAEYSRTGVSSSRRTPGATDLGSLPTFTFAWQRATAIGLSFHSIPRDGLPRGETQCSPRRSKWTSRGLCPFPREPASVPGWTWRRSKSSGSLSSGARRESA